MSDDPHEPDREEQAQKQALVEAAALRYLEDLAGGRCPVCHEPATEQQVGRSVYAEPCGHRMFEGRARKAVRP